MMEREWMRAGYTLHALRFRHWPIWVGNAAERVHRCKICGREVLLDKESFERRNRSWQA
jgi:hypothetical protein